MQTAKATISVQIKDYAHQLGFDACGFCKAESIGETEKSYVQSWIDKGYHAEMGYMGNNYEKRCDPTLLVEGAQSIVCVALNYYPDRKQKDSAPQIAYYAYGKDYHEVVKDKLQQLFHYIQSLIPTLSGRIFCDTAPVLERYWAQQAGLGFVGKNSLLIIPKKGSYFFLGELILDIELDYDTPLSLSCGNCTRCLTACPTQAIIAPKVVDANKCISYQTIENKGEIAKEIKPLLSNRFYGCDICQQVCPWNRYARPHKTEEFNTSDAFLELDYEKLKNMSVEEYQTTFKGSAMKRAKYDGLKRNIEALGKE